MEFPTERNSYRENFPFPAEGEAVLENPPTFIWVPVEGAKTYTVRITKPDGTPAAEFSSAYHYGNPEKPLDAGEYLWTVETDAGLKRREMRFSIGENALLFERVGAKELFDAVPAVRPRHLFAAEDIPALLAERETELAVLRRNAEEAYRHGFPPRPMFHRDPDAMPYREYFGMFRDYCDRDLIACAQLFALTGDEKAGAHAKRLFLDLCDWNPLGPCSQLGGLGDEVGLSMARCLPAAFDLLYPLLTDAERRYTAGTVAVYARECKTRIEKIDYPKNPSNSHVGRIPAYLGEAALVLKGEGIENDETLISWLDTALDIYNGIFPFYGGADGSWAEGAFYSTSYTKWYLPFFSAVERYTGRSLMNRPFYHRYSTYLLHFCNPDYENHPFGDGYWCSPESEEWPGFFAQNPFRVYADKFGPEKAREYRAKATDQPLYMLHLLDLFLPFTKPCANSLAAEPEDAVVFPDGGFAALHTSFGAEDNITVLARASRFGSDSHRHADQGSFALFAGGKAMISPSGYFGRRYGTGHHMKWTNATIAHNALLFNGEGQPTFSEKSAGRIIAFDKEKKSVTMDMSGAYESITLWQRTITLTPDGAVIRDVVEADEPVGVTYPLHTLVRPAADGDILTVDRESAKLTVTPVSGGLTLERVTDEYDVALNDGEPDAYAVTMPPQYHAFYRAKAAKRHELVVRYTVSFGE